MPVVTPQISNTVYLNFVKQKQLNLASSAIIVRQRQSFHKFVMKSTKFGFLKPNLNRSPYLHTLFFLNNYQIFKKNTKNSMCILGCIQKSLPVRERNAILCQIWLIVISGADGFLLFSW